MPNSRVGGINEQRPSGAGARGSAYVGGYSQELAPAGSCSPNTDVRPFTARSLCVPIRDRVTDVTERAHDNVCDQGQLAPPPWPMLASLRDDRLGDCN